MGVSSNHKKKENMKLVIDWKIFSDNINDFSKKAEKLIKTENEIIDMSKLEVIKTEEKLWRESCYNYLNSSFDEERNEFAVGFLSSNEQRYNIGNRQKDFREVKKEFFQDLNSRKKTLDYYLRFLNVCDAIIKPDSIDLEIRENFITEEILELILEKLYDLYDDYYHSIGGILEGNGIKLKRRAEDRELIKHLETMGYVSVTHSRDINAQLTTMGKMYIEEKRKKQSTNYSHINDSKSEVEDKINEIINRLDKLGLGQEILYEELEELKDLYEKLDKTNWGQLLKGKLIDLGLSQVINIDTMKYIYKELTTEILKLT